MPQNMKHCPSPKMMARHRNVTGSPPGGGVVSANATFVACLILSASLSHVYIYICTYTSTPLRKLAFHLDFFILVFLSIVGFVYHHAILSFSVCPLLPCFIGRAVQVSGDVELPFTGFGECEILVRWPIALSCGRRSQLKLIVCIDRTLENDDLEEGEIPASDLTLRGTCLGCMFRFFSDHGIEVLHGLTPWRRLRKTVKPHYQSDRA